MAYVFMAIIMVFLVGIILIATIMDKEDLDK